MDIKPFVYETHWWADATPAWIACIAFLALLIVAIVCTVRSEKSGNEVFWPFVLLIIGIVGVSAATGAASVMPDEAKTDAYKDYVAKAQKSLESDGFTIISGSPRLTPDTQSSLLLEYKNKSFDCTVFSPKDVNRKVVFSCGEAKLSLEDVKKTVEK